MFFKKNISDHNVENGLNEGQIGDLETWCEVIAIIQFISGEAWTKAMIVGTAKREKLWEFKEINYWREKEKVIWHGSPFTTFWKGGEAIFIEIW